MFPFHRLLARLQAQGFYFGVDTIQRLGSFWLLLAQSETTDRAVVKFQLAALICKTEEEQSQFYQIFEETYPADLELEATEIKPPTTPPPSRLPEKKTETEPPPAIKPEEPEEKPAPPPQPPPAVSTPSPVLPRLIFPDNPLRVWNLADMSKALTLHQEKVWAETSEWDVPATIRRTIQSGGIPQVVFRQRKHAPRYLALIEQKNPRDHLAGFAAQLVQELNRRDLEAEFYFYQKAPFKCWKELRDRRTHVFLEYLKSEWDGARLLLIGSAENFIDPFTGKPTNLALDVAEYWDEVALLSNASPLEWGAAEQSLSELFPVVPLSAAGLESLIYQWNSTWQKPLLDWQLQKPEPVPPDLSAAGGEDENSLIISIYRYLGKDAFRWACAAAAYPELYFELTAHLHDEAIPPQADLSEWEQNKRWNEALRNLSRLDWFRYGYLPEAIRGNLRSRLSPADLGTVEQELRRILEWSNNAVPPGSYAEEERNRLFEWLSGRSFRVLWIDDHPEHDVEYQERWTKQLGIFFRTARSMAEALAYLDKGEAFDFIISDTGRQGEPNTGISTLQTLRTRGVGAPVVFFTNKRGLNLRGVLKEGGAVEVTNSARVLEEILQGKVEEKFNPKVETAGSEPPQSEEGQSVDDEAERLLHDQVLLQSLGFFKGETDGRMSEEFRQAVMAFQKDKGLFADGIIGRQTRAVIERAEEELQQRLRQGLIRDVPEPWRNLQWSVCKIVLANGKNGTGFLVEGGFIFTANYILPDLESVKQAEVFFPSFAILTAPSFRLEESSLITNSDDIGFSRVRILEFNLEEDIRPLRISLESPQSDEKLSLIFFGQKENWIRKFSLNQPISSIHQFDVLFDAPETEPGAGGAPIFNERGEVVAIYDSIVDYMDLRKGVLMKEVMWYINASQGNRFDFWRGLIERGFTADVLEKMQVEYPDMGELKGYSEEYQKITAELKDGKLPHGEYERLFNNIGYRLNGLISLLDSRGSQGSYAA